MREHASVSVVSACVDGVWRRVAGVRGVADALVRTIRRIRSPTPRTRRMEPFTGVLWPLSSWPGAVGLCRPDSLYPIWVHLRFHPPAPTAVPVVRVIDGDTIVVRYDGKDERVRLLNIDAPERGEDGFDASTEALRKLIADRPVDLEWEEPGVPSRDRYGRLLAFVFAPVSAGPPGKRIHINVGMVRGGWAEYYTKYGKGGYAKNIAGGSEATYLTKIEDTKRVPRSSVCHPTNPTSP